MQSDAQLNSFNDLLKNIKFEKPLITVYSNVTGKVYEDKDYLIRRNLIQQIYKPVLWEQIIHRIYEKTKENEDEEYPETYECGPGNQLGTILKQVNNKAFVNYKNIDV
jgi:[acyl-carrier-protein] S-malonyltransferase